jgi:hypothetical protein
VFHGGTISMLTGRLVDNDFMDDGERISLHCQNAPKVSPEQWYFSPQVQKRNDYAIKRTRKSTTNQFCFQAGNKIVIY